MFSLKVSQNWEKYDYQRLRKRKYILFAKDDSWSFKSKKSLPCDSIFLNSIPSPLLVLSVLFTAASVLPFCSTFVREPTVRPAVMKEGVFQEREYGSHCNGNAIFSSWKVYWVVSIQLRELAVYLHSPLTADTTVVIYSASSLETLRYERDEIK